MKSMREIPNETDDDELEEIESCVRIVGNRMYFAGEITTENILTLNHQLDKLSVKLLKFAAEYSGYEPTIWLYINSDGGELHAGFSGMDAIRTCRVHVSTIADGLCASAATFLLLGGHSRYANENSQVLIHQLSSENFWGKYEELKNEIRSCDDLMDKLKELYGSLTDIPKKVYSKLMKRDLYLSARECVEYGIVSEII